ncbi:MAG: LTA synthase family protein [Elusimicrobiaceae bacterium]|nr:LTA synthase family protein [Elusimicrobiaceae bacterium]
MKLSQDFSFKFRCWFGYFLFLLGLFMLMRLAIWLVYHPVFQTLSTSETMGAFGWGLLFDTSTIFLFGIPVFVLLWLPVRSAKHLKALHVYWCLLVVFFVCVLVSDFVYFPEAKRHMAEELLYIKNEIGFLVRYALTGYWWAFLLLAGFAAGFIKLGFMLINRFYKPTPQAAWKSIVAILCAVAVVFLGIRGRLHGKALSTRSLNQLSTSTAQGVLMSNGVFSAYHSLRRGQAQIQNPLPKEQAWAIAQELLSSPQETFTDPDYPLLRAVKTQKPLQPRNVFVVLMESWTPRYIDAYGNNQYGVTPNFDNLARQGVMFTNAYAVGVRSIFGIGASFAGVPLVPGIGQFSDGLELNAITSVARVLRQRGYYTAFMQSSLRSSYQMCSMAEHIFKFEESYGMEDLPQLMNYQAEQDFGYDYDLLQSAADKAAQAHAASKPFFIFTFTGTTHTPFNSTTKQFEKYPRTSEENKYLNTLFYADYSIGKLIERARQEGWLEDTIFMFVADHTLGLAQKGDDIYQKFRIPFVIYAPGFLAPRTIQYPVSQLDLIPTLFHLLNLTEPFSALGVDGLNPHITHRAFITEGGNLALITPEGFLRHDRSKGLESSLDKTSEEYARLEQEVLALDKSVTSLFQSNHWAK